MATLIAERLPYEIVKHRQRGTAFSSTLEHT